MMDLNFSMLLLPVCRLFVRTTFDWAAQDGGMKSYAKYLFCR
jgi:hypothetical protein